MNTQQEQLLRILFILIWVLAFTHLAAEHFYLYWTFRWFDIVTHFIGGVWIGLAAIWLWYYSEYLRKVCMPTKRAIVVAFLAGLSIGLLWELFEYGIWELQGEGLPSNYVPDSLLDIAMDSIGAVTGYGVFHVLVRRTERLEEES